MPLHSLPAIRTFGPLVLTGALLLGATTAAGQVGAGAGASSMLNLTTSSAAARMHALAGLDDINNAFFPRGAMHLKQALALDPDVGVVRVLYASVAPGLTDAERNAEMDRGVVDAAKASPRELIFAAGLRESFQGRFAQAKPILESAVTLMPADANVAYAAAFAALNAAPSAGEGLQAIRHVTEAFPDSPAAYNTLAYTLWATGDKAGALEAVQNYVARLPGHPNPHDSYAELLQWSGRYEEATLHYQKAAELDPDFAEAAMGLAEVSQLQGRGAQARAYISQAMQHAPSIDVRLFYQRGKAGSYLIEGNVKAAMVEWSEIAGAARTNGLADLEALAHEQMAAIDGLLGDGKSVSAHLADAAVTGDGNAVRRQTWSALALAGARRTGDADQAVDRGLTAAEGNDNALRRLHAIRGLILLNAGKPADGMAEAAQADPADQLARAVSALCAAKSGQTATARALRDQVLGEKVFALTDPSDAIARAMVRKIT